MDTTVADAVAAATSVGVTRIVTVGDSVESSRWCADIAAAHDDVWAAVAIHPNNSDAASDTALAAIDALAALPQVRAVGETGLDNYWDRVDAAVQQASFRAHIAIAKKHGKALVIHDRDAHDAVLRVLEEEGAPEQTVLHCFSGDAQLARRCAERGYLMSFAGTVTFRNAQSLRDALLAVPAELVLVETDSPFLTPTPFRGRPNAPAMIPYTVRAMAQVRGIDEDDMAATVAANAERAFGPWA
jgi:TatD DNase family protein